MKVAPSMDFIYIPRNMCRYYGGFFYSLYTTGSISANRAGGNLKIPIRDIKWLLGLVGYILIRSNPALFHHLTTGTQASVTRYRLIRNELKAARIQFSTLPKKDIKFLATP